MGVEASISDGTAEFRLCTPWHGQTISLQVFLSEAKVYQVYSRRGVTFTDSEVGRLDVSMDEPALMHVLNTV